MNARKSVLVLAAGLLVGAALLVGCDLFVGKGDVAVEVYDAGTSEAIAGASVALDRHSTTTDVEGGCQFLEVSAGPHVLNVTAPGYDPHSEAIEVETGVLRTIYVYLDPGPTGQISGLVTCQCGRGLPGIAVFLDGEQVATTDADGLFLFNAPVGQHTVTAGTPDATGSASQSVEVAEGGEYQADLVINN